MNLKFKRQQFQIDAVDAACDLFKGQRAAQSVFSVEAKDMLEQTDENFAGYGNALTIDEATLQKNLNAVQERFLLPLTKFYSGQLSVISCQNEDENNSENFHPRFNIEMETGTGKTYVYIKTIFEMNKLYGFSKFVILVPSIAIREGTYHSFQVMESHFAKDYDGRRPHYFIYNSKKLNEVRDFATSSTLEVMIVTIDAINKDANLFNQETDRMDKTAREFMAECRPIMIIDEPQSIDTTPKARAAIKNLNPLCELRYSATHKEKVNTIYRLTPVDAYEKKIVKQICIVSDSVADGFNKPYIHLIEVGKKSGYYAKIEVDVKDPKSGLVSRVVKTVTPDTKLFALTGREIYEGYEIAGIDVGGQSIEFSNMDTLEVGKTIGSVDEMVLKREQIKTTVLLHLEKERQYIKHGIKVLSLFFIDEVAKYRSYQLSVSSYQKGIYAKMFEEAYLEFINMPKFDSVREYWHGSTAKLTTENWQPETSHNGYFSADKKGNYKDTKGDTADDYSTYQLIMQKKEELLSFSSPLRFIFSHSALKEGWDNPNVFQICTLIENRTPFTCRQKIGRGLRLCVDQTGERIDDENINILHVISNEGFAEFASKLQTEIEELGVKFGILDIGMFVNISYAGDGGTASTVISHADASEILQHFREKNYIDSSGKMKKTLKEDLAKGTVDLPARFEKARERIQTILKSADKKVEIKPYKQQVSVKRKDEMFASPEFLAIWNRMKQKTIFRLNMDTGLLFERCVKAISDMDEVRSVRIKKEEARIDIEKSGVSFEGTRERFADAEQEFLLPDVVSSVAAACRMPKKQVGEILLAANRWVDFVNNPVVFAEQVTAKIKEQTVDVMMEDGIKYTKLDGKECTYYEVFKLDEERELSAFLDYNALSVSHSVYDHIVFDSDVESKFAAALDRDPDVKLFFKIPTTFKITTPITPQGYSPDWAVYYETDGEKKLYFIIETKGSTDKQDLKGKENFKIMCGRKHFAAIDTDISYQVSTDWSKARK
jgi:type III restriction enzyme